MLSGPTSFWRLMMLMSYVPLVEDDKKMAANQFSRNSSTVKEGNEVSNELLKQKPNIQQNTNTCMVTFAQTYLPSFTKNQWKQGKFHLIGTMKM
jgi:hypothetical protein